MSTSAELSSPNQPLSHRVSCMLKGGEGEARTACDRNGENESLKQLLFE